MRLQYESVAEVNPIKKKRKAMEYMEFMRENDVNPIKNLLYMTPNAITFMSFYWALKGMASVSVTELGSHFIEMICSKLKQNEQLFNL